MYYTVYLVYQKKQEKKARAGKNWPPPLWNISTEMGLFGGDGLREKETEACGSIVTLVEGCERAWAEQEVINGGGAASPSPVWKAGRAKGEGEQDDTMSHNNQHQYAWCAIQY